MDNIEIEILKTKYFTNRDNAMQFMQNKNYAQATPYLKKALNAALDIAEASVGTARKEYLDKAEIIQQALVKISSTLKSGNVTAVSSESARSKNEAESGKLKNSAEISPPKKLSLEAAFAELEALEGLYQVKRQVKNIIKKVQINEQRKRQGLPQFVEGYHLIFTGNPGTGKTTVARLVADIFSALGFLSKGQLVEVNARVGLVAGYVGQTAIKTQELVDSALGGVLFIDEAHNLYKGDKANDFGKEAIGVLLTAVENHRNDFLVILAGYPKEISELLGSDPGFPSRFKFELTFEDYGPEEWYNIFMKMCAKNSLRIESDNREFKQKLINTLSVVRDKRGKEFGNARDVRTMFEVTTDKQANRLAQESGGIYDLSREQLSILKLEDLPNEKEILDAIVTSNNF